MRAKYVIDASGRNSVIGNKFKLKKSYQHLQKLSLFAHYEGLEREAVVGCRQGARDGITGTFRLLHRQKMINGLFKSALEQVLVALEGDEGGWTVARGT